FLVDANHGWQPRDRAFGIWPPTQGDRGMDRLLAHAYSWDGRLDFESGYLPNGRYGDVFDVVTNTASTPVLAGYGAVWALGDVPLDVPQRQALMTYVERGGTLVLDGSTARNFSAHFTGVRVADGFMHDTRIQTALQDLGPLSDPYQHRPMALVR